MKPILHKIYFTLLLIIAATGVTFAQTDGQTANVSGSLLDEQGKPMTYATAILLNAKDSTIVKSTLSNESGVYAFEHIKTGSYIIKASTVGYEKAITPPFN